MVGYGWGNRRHRKTSAAINLFQELSPLKNTMAQQAQLSAEIDTLNHVLSLVEAFKAFDEDGDGRITAAELSGLLSSLGYRPTEQDVRAMMQQGDTNRNGLLSITDFLELNTKNLDLGSLANLFKMVLESLDVYKDEVVTGELLHELSGNLGLELPLETCDDIVASLSVDEDGTMDIEEFRVVMNSILQVHGSQ